MHQFKISLLCVLVTTLVGCGSRSGDNNDLLSTDEVADIVIDRNIGYVTPAGVEECSVEDVKRRVEYDMGDYYIYYDSVPTLNQADYETPEEYIRALRVDPDIYSSVRDAATQSSFFEEGETEGYGFWIDQESDGIYRFKDVSKGSSVEAAGILRGDAVLEINGLTYADITNTEFNDIFLREEGNVVNVMVQTGDDAPRTVQIEYGVYTVRTAGPSTVFSPNDNPNLNVGYLPVDSFLETTRGEIDEAFENMRTLGGIDELVLDLRYNGGGRVSVANYLSSIIAGDVVANQQASYYEFNDKYEEFEFEYTFDEVESPLNLSRVIVLTTQYSASSSEIVINSLAAYIDVVVVGETTEGKAFISSAQEYCGKAINAMSAIGKNANGVSVIGGIAPTCPVGDTWFHPTSSPSDPLLGSALNYARDQACDVAFASNENLLRRSVESESTGRSDMPGGLFVDE